MSVLSIRLTQAIMALRAIQIGHPDGRNAPELRQMLMGLRQIHCAVQEDGAPPIGAALHRAADALLRGLVAVSEAVLTDAPLFEQICADLAEDNAIFDMELRRFAQLIWLTP